MKGFKQIVSKLLQKISRYSFVNMLIAALSLIVGAWGVFYTIHKDKREFEFSLQNFPLESNNEVYAIYLCPILNNSNHSLKGCVPFKVTNKYSQTLESLIVQIKAEFGNMQYFKDLSKNKVSDSIFYRFEKKISNFAPGAERYYHSNSVEEILQYTLTELHPNLSFDINEILRFNPRDIKEKGIDGTCLYDLFALTVNIGYKDSEDIYTSKLNIGIVNISDLKQFIQYVNTSGTFPYSSNIEPNKIETDYNPEIFLLQPRLKLNAENSSYELTDIEVYKISYRTKNFYSNRILTIYDSRGNEQIVSFKDLDRKYPITYYVEKALKELK